MIIRDRRIWINKIDIADILRACSLLLVVLITITFFAACANSSQADAGSGIRKREHNVEAYGEVGAGYGRRM